MHCKHGNLMTITANFTFACAHISKNKHLIVRRHVTGVSVLRHGAGVSFNFPHFGDDMSTGKPNNMLSSILHLVSTKTLSTNCLPANVLKIVHETLTGSTTGFLGF